MQHGTATVHSRVSQQAAACRSAQLRVRARGLAWSLAACSEEGLEPVRAWAGVAKQLGRTSTCRQRRRRSCTAVCDCHACCSSWVVLHGAQRPAEHAHTTSAAARRPQRIRAGLALAAQARRTLQAPVHGCTSALMFSKRPSNLELARKAAVMLPPPGWGKHFCPAAGGGSPLRCAWLCRPRPSGPGSP